MITSHEELRANARTVNNDPTETDQSGAAETDLNVILKRYAQSGTIQSHGLPPMYEDWTELPEDFRGFIHKARELGALQDKLPAQLRNLPTEALLALTREQLSTILTPPAQPTDKPKEEAK